MGGYWQSRGAGGAQRVLASPRADPGRASQPPVQLIQTMNMPARLLCPSYLHSYATASKITLPSLGPLPPGCRCQLSAKHSTSHLDFASEIALYGGADPTHRRAWRGDPAKAQERHRQCAPAERGVCRSTAPSTAPWAVLPGTG